MPEIQNESHTLEIMIHACEGCHRGDAVVGHLTLNSSDLRVMDTTFEDWRAVLAPRALVTIERLLDGLLSDPMTNIIALRESYHARPYDELVVKIKEFIITLETYPQGTVYNAKYRPDMGA